MRSGVSRASVRSRLRWRMISWPAAKQMRWVKPSIATVSPSRTSSPIASRIEATLEALIRRSPRPAALAGPAVARRSRLGRHLGDGLAEEPHRRVDLVDADGQRGRHPDRRPARLQDEQPALEGRGLDGIRMLARVELDADHEALAPD